MGQSGEQELKDRAAVIASGYLANPKLVDTQEAVSPLLIARAALAIARELDARIGEITVGPEGLRLSHRDR